MDPQVQASFIPKRSLDVSAPRGGGFGGLLFLISLLIFIASLVAAGGVFTYTKILNTQIAAKAHSLQLAEGAYDPGTIEDLVRLDSRLTQAKTLLASHIAVSGVFNFLSTQTLQNVSFSTFDFALNTDNSAKISMQGLADSFSTVALQSDQFGSNKLLKDVVFSGISVDNNGNVSFNVSATVDSSVLSYGASLGQAVTLPTSTTAPSTPATPTAGSTTSTGTGAFPTQ